METVVWSKPEHERPGTPLLVMLHGYGTDESRMSKLFGSLPPEFSCAALRGPKDIGDHHGWFLLDYFLTHDFGDVIGLQLDRPGLDHGCVEDEVRLRSRLRVCRAVHALRGRHTIVSFSGGAWRFHERS